MSAIYSKTSFDRFGDDLCGVVLSYLPLIEKIRFESVSHQWKSKVFERVDRIKFEARDEFTRVIISTEKTKPFNMKGLESVLKKCPHIRDISIHIDYMLEYKLGRNYDTDYHMDVVYELFMKYCPRLNSFHSSYHWVSQEMSERFNQFFGHRFETFVYESAFDVLNKDIQSFANLKKLEMYLPFGYNTVFKSNFKGLTDLNVRYNMEQQYVVKDILRDNPEIRRLTISESGFGTSEMDQMIPEVKSLKNLTYFSIGLVIMSTPLIIFDYFKELGQLSNSLTKLKVGNINFGSFDFPYLMLNAVKYMPLLTHLQLYDSVDCGLNCGDYEPKEMSSEVLKNCQNLKHLSLCFSTLNDNFFVDIDKYLPKLQELKADNYDITEKAILESISKLKELQSFCLVKYRRRGGDFKPFQFKTIRHLFNGCPKLKSFILKNGCEQYEYTRVGTDISRFDRNTGISELMYPLIVFD